MRNNNLQLNSQKTLDLQEECLTTFGALEPFSVCSRRNAITLLSLSTLTGLLGISGCRSDSPTRREKTVLTNEPNVDQNVLVEMLNKYGDVVYDKTIGSPKKLFIIMKHFHGGPAENTLFLTDPEYYRIFSDHQNLIAGIAKKTMVNFGAKKIHFMIEGPDFAGSSIAWPKDDRDFLKSIAAGNTYDLLYADVLSKSRNDPVVAKKMTAFTMIRANFQLAVFCQTFPHATNSLQGAEKKGSPVFNAEVHDLIDSFIDNNPSPTDQKLNGLLSTINEMGIRDFDSRHSYIVDCASKMSEGSATLIVLGASHSASGYNPPNTIVINPLEDYMAKLSDSRVLVFEDRRLKSLFNYVPPSAASHTIVDFNCITVDQLRMLLPQLKSERH